VPNLGAERLAQLADDIKGCPAQWLIDEHDAACAEF
jgi:hypothetical protein